jgi:hypothetical protein
MKVAAMAAVIIHARPPANSSGAIEISAPKGRFRSLADQ